MSRRGLRSAAPARRQLLETTRCVLLLLVGGHAAPWTVGPRLIASVLGAALFVSAPAFAAPPAAEDSEAVPDWAFSALGYVYFVPDDSDYVQPTLTADHRVLHLEARYNYEALFTASLWAGYNFSGGNELAWTLTPMVGGVFGASRGVAPGVRGSLSYWKLELSSEGEYLFDFDDPEASFFNWSELTVAPLAWLNFGLVTQRTRVYASTRGLQRGVLAGVSFWIASLTAYVLNPDDSRPIVIVAASLSVD